MKIKPIFYLGLALLLISCNGNEAKSDAYGNFEAEETTISARANGEIMEFKLEEGDDLKSGQVIGWIDTTDLSLKKDQLIAQRKAVGTKIPSFDAQIAVYEQQRKNLLRDVDRITKMFNDGAATQKQVDDLNGQVEITDKQIKAVKSQMLAIYSEMETIDKSIAQVEESIRKAVIINPEEGTVLTKFVEKNEMATMGKPLYKIAGLDALKLKVYISGDQLPQVKLGQEVQVLIDKTKTGNTTMPGKVIWISESAEFTPKIIQTKEERVNLVYAVKVLVENDGSLKIGMPGEVRF
jgi:HlyD family secretion protein